MVSDRHLKEFLQKKLRMATGGGSGSSSNAVKKFSGNLESFDARNDDLESWLGLFDIFCKHNKIQDENVAKVEALLMHIGKESAMQITLAVQPETVYQKSFDLFIYFLGVLWIKQMEFSKF